MLDIVLGVLEQGLIYSLVVMAVYLSSRVLSFDDLSTEGSFGIGGAVASVLLMSQCSLWSLFLIVLLTGALVGVTTGLIHTQLKINNLISGIVVTCAAFSVCLRLAGANISLTDVETFFSFGLNLFGELNILMILLVINLFAFLFVKFLLKTEVGFMLRAVGVNPQMLINLGKNVDFYKILGLSISNSLTALAGALFVQYSGFFSITGSVGILVIALAGLILSETIAYGFGVALILGSIFYQAIVSLTFEFEVDPVWNKLVTSILIIVLMSIKKILANKTTNLGEAK